MDSFVSFLKKFFGVVIRPQTYLNLAYLGLAFPLGLFYFIFFITGFSLGLPLTILWVGFFILAFVFAAAWLLTLFERQMAIWMLRVEIPPVAKPMPETSSVWERFKAYLGNPVTWKGLLYLILKFPLGTITFIIWTTCLALSFGLLASPFIYPYVVINLFDWQIQSLPAALIAFVAGLIVLPASLHLLNATAYLWGLYNRSMLGLTQQAPAAPAPVQPVEAGAQ